MRLSSPSLLSSIDISDALVVSDDYHLSLIPPEAFGTNCEFAPSGLRDDSALPIVLIDSRVEVISAFVDQHAKAVGLAIPRFGVVAPLGTVDLLRLLLDHPATASLALTELAFDGTWIAVTLEAATTDATCPADDLVAAFELGQSAGSPSAIAETTQNDEFLPRYAALLEHVAEYGLTSRENAASESKDRKKADAVEMETLINSLVEAQAALGSLQRKYDALAGSALGALTLRYWAAKRGRR